MAGGGDGGGFKRMVWHGMNGMEEKEICIYINLYNLQDFSHLFYNPMI